MADTVRHLIMENLLTRLQAISTTGGYSANYGLVTEWKLSGITTDQYPAIILIDDNQDVVAHHERVKTDYSLRITVAVLCKGDETQTNLRNYIADVYKCIGADTSCGGYADYCDPVGDRMNLIQADYVYGDIEVRFDVLYSTKAYDVYTPL